MSLLLEKKSLIYEEAPGPIDSLFMIALARVTAAHLKEAIELDGETWELITESPYYTHDVMWCITNSGASVQLSRSLRRDQ